MAIQQVQDQPKDVPDLWTVPSYEKLSPDAQRQLRAAVRNALEAVEQIQSRIPAWRRLVASLEADSKVAEPAWKSIADRLDGGTEQSDGQPQPDAEPLDGGHHQVGPVSANRPHELLTMIGGRDRKTQHAQDEQAKRLGERRTFCRLLGLHAELLTIRLEEARSAWNSAHANAQNADATSFQASLDLLTGALDGAMQHSLFLTFLHAVDQERVGETLAVDDHCANWGLTSSQVDVVWQWITNDPHALGGLSVEIAIDKTQRCAYRECSSLRQRVVYASALIWGGALFFGLVVGLFVLLHVAGSWDYSTKWVLRLLVLFLFVSLGAWAHIGAKVINVNYDNPLSIYSARTKLDWVALYWMSVLQMYIPVGVVTAALWGAGNVPTSFQKLGTALLAGYSADSFVSALSKAKGTSQPTAASSQNAATPDPEPAAAAQ